MIFVTSDVVYNKRNFERLFINTQEKEDFVTNPDSLYRKLFTVACIVYLINIIIFILYIIDKIIQYKCPKKNNNI